MAEKQGVRVIIRSLRVIFLMILLSNLLGCNLPRGGGDFTGTSKNILVVFMKHTKQPMCPTIADCLPWWNPNMVYSLKPPRHSASEYEAILDTEVNDYYLKATYGQVHFNFHVLVNPNSLDGWWDAPHALWEFNQKKATYMGDAVLIASRVIGADFSKYDQLLVIQNIAVNGGQNCDVHYPPPDYAVPCNFLTDDGQVVSINVSEASMHISDEKMIPVICHELAHGEGAPDEYLEGFTGMAGWDLMGDHSQFNHFGAWTKLDRGWISWTENTTKLCLNGSCEVTTALDPLEIKGNNALLVPYNSSPEFVGLMAECRKRMLGDENIYMEGVLLTTTNPYLNDSQMTIVQLHSPNKDIWSTLKPGETYYDSAREIRITNISKPGEQACTIKASRNAPQVPDPYILEGSEQAGENFTRYSSQDIWIDNEKNGMEAYPASEKISSIKARSTLFPYSFYDINFPDGSGDPIWLKHKNVVKFIIHNDGIATATDFKVNVYVRQPLVAEVQNTDCGAASDAAILNPGSLPKLLGTVVVPLLGPGENYLGYVDWTPDSSAPAEIEVSIEEYPGESDIYNNTAYETIVNYFHEPASLNNDYSEVGSMQLSLSKDCTTGLTYQSWPLMKPGGKACGLDLQADPATGVIQPGETLKIGLKARPKADSRPGEACSSAFGIAVPENGDYRIVGGFAFKASVVDPASITCSAPGGAQSLNAAVSVSGKLNPVLADTIALEYTGPGGIATIQNPHTDSRGAYTDSFSPALAGAWTVQAFWQGDGSHAPAESSLCRFTVKDVATPTPTFTPSPTFTLTPAVLNFTPNINAYCRTGPDSVFPSNEIAMKGQAYLMDGRNLENSWYRIMMTANRGCWVPKGAGSASGDTAALRVLADVPTPTPTVSAPISTLPTKIIPTLIVSCRTITDPASCNAQSACEWYQPVTTAGYCTDK